MAMLRYSMGKPLPLLYSSKPLRRGQSGGIAGGPCDLKPGLSITMGYGADGLQHMFLDGEDVTAAIRENDISACASKAAALPAVRDFLMEMQRRTAREHP